MKRFCRPLLLAASLLLSAAAPPDTAGLGFTQRLGNHLPPNLPLLGSNGQPTTLGRLLDHKPTLLILGYFACPMLCGVVRDDALRALSASGLSLPRDYALLFLSIDPAEQSADAAQAKAADMARFPLPGAAAGWHYATADAATIERVESGVGYGSRYDPALKQFLHPAGLVVLTPDAVVSGYLLGVGYQPGALAQALRQARAGTIGQQAPFILLLCFHYDASTGRYSLAVLKVLRLMAGLTLVLLAVLLLALRLRRRPA